MSCAKRARAKRRTGQSGHAPEPMRARKGAGRGRGRVVLRAGSHLDSREEIRVVVDDGVELGDGGERASHVARHVLPHVRGRASRAVRRRGEARQVGDGARAAPVSAALERFDRRRDLGASSGAAVRLRSLAVVVGGLFGGTAFEPDRTSGRRLLGSCFRPQGRTRALRSETRANHAGVNNRARDEGRADVGRLAEAGFRARACSDSRRGACRRACDESASFETAPGTPSVVGRGSSGEITSSISEPLARAGTSIDGRLLRQPLLASAVGSESGADAPFPPPSIRGKAVAVPDAAVESPNRCLSDGTTRGREKSRAQPLRGLDARGALARGIGETAPRSKRRRAPQRGIRIAQVRVLGRQPRDDAAKLARVRDRRGHRIAAQGSSPLAIVTGVQAKFEWVCRDSEII